VHVRRHEQRCAHALPDVPPPRWRLGKLAIANQRKRTLDARPRTGCWAAAMTAGKCHLPRFAAHWKFRPAFSGAYHSQVPFGDKRIAINECLSYMAWEGKTRAHHTTSVASDALVHEIT
jgi:hypothetical protein